MTCIPLHTDIPGVNYLLATILSAIVLVSIATTTVSLSFNTVLGRITVLHLLYLLFAVPGLVDFFRSTEGMQWPYLFQFIKLFAYLLTVPTGFLTAFGWSEYLLLLKHVIGRYPEDTPTVESAMRKLRKLPPDEVAGFLAGDWLRFKVHKLWLMSQWAISGPIMFCLLPFTAGLIPSYFVLAGIFTAGVVSLIFWQASQASSASETDKLGICFPTTLSFSFTLISWSLDALIVFTLFTTSMVDISFMNMLENNVKLQHKVENGKTSTYSKEEDLWAEDGKQKKGGVKKQDKDSEPRHSHDSRRISPSPDSEYDGEGIISARAKPVLRVSSGIKHGGNVLVEQEPQDLEQNGTEVTYEHGLPQHDGIESVHGTHNFSETHGNEHKGGMCKLWSRFYFWWDPHRRFRATKLRLRILMQLVLTCNFLPVLFINKCCLVAQVMMVPMCMVGGFFMLIVVALIIIGNV